MPELEDDSERRETDPPGWHVRERTADGYPLMGSSPAERAEAVLELARIWKQSEITGHRFEGDGPYCEAMLARGSSGDLTRGVITMSSQCGYSADLHVDAEPTRKDRP